MSTNNLNAYLKDVDLAKVFKKLGAVNSETLAKTVAHFTTKEAKKRDKIVLGYFGDEGINRIVKTITQKLLSAPSLRKGSNVLDVGAGSGFFTAKIAEKIPYAKLYAMDVTPAMLRALAKRDLGITPFIGVAENIEASIREAASYTKIPSRFDAAFSTLMLHHSVNPEKVFESLKDILTEKGKAIVLDLCKHNFTEFKTEMEDIYLGFDLAFIRKVAKKYFSNVEIMRMPGIGCTCSGHSAEIFVARMHNRFETVVL